MFFEPFLSHDPADGNFDFVSALSKPAERFGKSCSHVLLKLYWDNFIHLVNVDNSLVRLLN